MKQKLKKIFENSVWWSGVITLGIALGISLQFVRAWSEPTVAPPGGNVGAPINTSSLGQFKQGVLQLLGLTLYNDPQVSGDVTGKVLTAQNAYGAVAWAAPGGGVASSGIYGWCLEGGPANHQGKCGWFITNVKKGMGPPKPPAFCDASTDKCTCPSGYDRIMLGENMGYEGSLNWKYLYACYKQ